MKKLFLFSFLAVFLAWLWFGGVSMASSIECTEAVAKIWDTCYDNIASAISSITGSSETTIILQKDTTESFSIDWWKNIILDLWTHNLTWNGAWALLTLNKWKLTIKNWHTYDWYIDVNPSCDSNKQAWDYNYLVIDETAIIDTIDSNWLRWGHSINLNDCKEDKTKWYWSKIDIKWTVKNWTVWILGNKTQWNSEINVYWTIDLSEVQGWWIWQNWASIVNVFEWASIVAYWSAIEVRAGTLNIKWWNFEAMCKNLAVTPTGDGDTTDAVALAIAQHTTKLPINVNIEGWTFSWVKSILISDPQNNQDKNNISVKVNWWNFNGWIVSTSGIDDIQNWNGWYVVNFISWWTFSDTVPSEYLSENADIVVTDAEAKIWNIQYKTLSDAIGAAESGNVIILLTGIDINHQLTINKSLTLDWNNNTLNVDHDNTTSWAAAWILVLSTNNVTIKNLKVDGPNKWEKPSWQSNQHVIKVYDSSNVTIEDVEVDHWSEAMHFNNSTGIVLKWNIKVWENCTYWWFEAKNSTVDVSEATIDKAVWIWDNDWFASTVNWDGWIKKCKDDKELGTCNSNGDEYQWWQNEYTITKLDVINWTIAVSVEKAIKWTEITLTATPNSNYNFWSWNVKDSEWNAITVSNDKFTMPASNVTVSATFSYKSTSSWWGGGGGGSSSSSCKNLPSNAAANNSKKPSSSTNYFYDTDTTKVCSFVCKEGYEWNKTDSKCEVKKTTTTTWDNTKVDETKVDESTNENTGTDIGDTTSNEFSKEFNDAYTWAFKNGITTMDSIEKADMNAPLTRIAMAKMLSQYAINVLGKTPDTTKVVPTFPDVDEQLNKDYNDWVTLAYQLGIMWINIDSFRPFDLVTRAEFGTALSRMLFGLSDGEEDLWYKPHLDKLMNEKIITIDTPDLQELRGYVMIMLMRSAQ